MGRNEIRLRRNRLAGKGSDRYRNYGAVLQQHEKEMRIKKKLKVFSLFLVILIVLLLIIIIDRVGEKASKKTGYDTERPNTAKPIAKL